MKSEDGRELNPRHLKLEDFSEQELTFYEEHHWRKDFDLIHGFMVSVGSPCGEWCLRLQLTEGNETAVRDWLNLRENPGEFRFIGHEDVGAEMAWNIIYRLVPANKWLDRKDGSTEKQMTVSDATLAMDVEWLVMNHMRAHRLQEMSRKKQAELLRCRGACDLIDLAYADAMGREPQLEAEAIDNLNFCHRWIENDVRLKDVGITVEEMVTMERDLPKCVTKMGIMENLLTKDPTKTREELLKAVGLGE